MRFFFQLQNQFGYACRYPISISEAKTVKGSPGLPLSASCRIGRLNCQEEDEKDQERKSICSYGKEKKKRQEKARQNGKRHVKSNESVQPRTLHREVTSVIAFASTQTV